MDVPRGAGSTEGPGARRPWTGRTPGIHLAPVPDAPGAPLARHIGLADQLAPMVDVWERLLAAHQPDGHGRCRTCTQGGTGLPATRWPCALHGLADLARSRHGLAEGA